MKAALNRLPAPATGPGIMTHSLAPADYASLLTPILGQGNEKACCSLRNLKSPLHQGPLEN